MKTNGETTEISPRDGKIFSLKELQEIVGGNIEILYVSNFNKLMIINENGKLEGLPFNKTATMLVLDDLLANDYIVGDALVCDSNFID